MAEVYETEETKKPDFERYVDIAQRRHMHFLIPLLFGWLLVWGISWILPPRYKSTTLILVEEPAMAKNMVAANIGDDLQQRLQNMQQQILSRTRLLLIIDSMHLYDGGRKPLTDDEKVAKMRKEIVIDLVRDAQNAGVTAFKIDYSSHSARVAQLVTGQLADLFISEDQKQIVQSSGDTTKFLKSQLDDARTQLAAQDEKVKEFQTAHVGALPEQAASNMQILGGLQTQLTNEQDALNNASQQKALHETEIQQFRTNPLPNPRAGEPIDPNGTQAIDIQLAKLRDQLTDLRSRYTDSYPDVVKLKAQIAQVEVQRKQAALVEKARGDKTADSLALAQLQGQLKSDELEIENRKNSIAALQVRIAEYTGRINAEPASAQELADLKRGYDQSEANYNDLLKKMQESEMATSMELMQQGEQFKMLDPPSLPLKPDFPNRLEFCALGLVAGLAFGAISVAAFEMRDDRLHYESDISDLLPVPVICEIPEVTNPADQEVQKKRTFFGWATAAAVMVIILAGSAVSYLHG
jgi:polysaccharide chain length determinant protein (PEP-CTERM system associated)